MERMFPVKGAIFVEFQLFLGIAPVFAGSIIPPLALTTLQSHQFHRSLLARHIKPLLTKQCYSGVYIKI
jgi:hypothetical protein